MKKRIIALVGAILMLTMVLCACESTEIINSQTSENNEGNYWLFKTCSEKEYLNFLETFDETKYEIVDISINDGYYASDEYYFVTYKTTQESEEDYQEKTNNEQ